MTAVRVTTAAQAAARDGAAIAAGTDSFALMLQAGTVAAAEVVRRAPERLALGVDVLVGAGNNGGDGYVVAAQLARVGVPVRVLMAAPPRTPDAQRAQALARRLLPPDALAALDEQAVREAPCRGVVVDALLGTGASGPLRGAVATGAAGCRAAQAAGVPVFALDVPTGVDATNGDRQDGHVRAHHTITFGSCKSGLLAARDACGRIVVADIGLGTYAALADGAALLADADVLRHAVPAIVWDAHKGTRGRVLVVGGDDGMAGAVHLVARGALGSGAGLLRAVVHAASARALQASVPAAVCAPAEAMEMLVGAWAHAVVLGPGLGRTDAARATVERVLAACRRAASTPPAPMSAPALVLDADALPLLASSSGVAALRALAQRTAVLLTPHAGECALLAHACGVPFSAHWRDPAARLAAAQGVAQATGCTVLLKGAPTVCASPSGVVWCVPRGSAALATGGTGDVLSGVLAALLASAIADPASVGDPTAMLATELSPHAVSRAEAHGRSVVTYAALGAWVHGVAGERALGTGGVRGTTVDHVVRALRGAWAQLYAPVLHAPGVLAEVPSVRG
jgi:hydroxyethylthiazole kinase-like uncharacterized protein yjeF